jgi:hypothetical protein
MLLYELCSSSSVRTQTYRETRIKRAVFSNLRGRRELQLYTVLVKLFLQKLRVREPTVCPTIVRVILFEWLFGKQTLSE